MDEAFLTGDDDLFERIVHLGQRSLFVLLLALAVHAEGRLDIIAFAALVAYKVNFQLGTLLLSVLVADDYGDNSDVNVETSNQQLIVDDVFHYVGLFILSEIDAGVAQSHVGEIILGWGVDIFLAFDIITHRL